MSTERLTVPSKVTLNEIMVLIHLKVFPRPTTKIVDIASSAVELAVLRLEKRGLIAPIDKSSSAQGDDRDFRLTEKGEVFHAKRGRHPHAGPAMDRSKNLTERSRLRD